MFFAGATHNSVANAALIGSLAPFLIVPAGAWLFKEYIDPRALVFAAVAFGGVALVLLTAPLRGHIGLASSAERVDAIGGSFTLEPGPPMAAHAPAPVCPRRRGRRSSDRRAPTSPPDPSSRA